MGEVWLAFAMATTICLIGLFWQYPRRARVVIYEFSELALWIGGFVGSFPYLIRFVYGWIISASLGGLILCVRQNNKSCSPARSRALRVGSVLALVLQACLVMAGFAQLLLIEQRPRVSFLAIPTPVLDSLAFSPDGNTLATVGGFGIQRKIAGLLEG